MSMLRYYMTPQTRQSLIEESNRQIAMRAIASAASGRRVPVAVDEAETVSESAFARLVADLEATSQGRAG